MLASSDPAGGLRDGAADYEDAAFCTFRREQKGANHADSTHRHNKRMVAITRHNRCE